MPPLSLSVRRRAEPLAVRAPDPGMPPRGTRERLRVSLFGRARVEFEGHAVAGCEGGRAQELFCYLLLHRERPHPREGLASLLWGDHCTTKQSKAYLRKALWRLQSSLHAEASPAGDVVEADAGWIGIAPAAGLWLDVTALEDAFARVRDVPCAALEESDAAVLRAAVGVYGGALLEGWYQEWCLVERERLQQIYLLLLDKLMAYAERSGAYEAGLVYGERSLRADPARERTYRRLMRLHHALGDRTGALRVYERCAEAVRDELDTHVSAETVALAERVRRGALRGGQEPADGAGGLSEVAARLERIAALQRQLAELHERADREIRALRQMVLRGAGDDAEERTRRDTPG